jgi:hypothetical protein
VKQSKKSKKIRLKITDPNNGKKYQKNEEKCGNSLKNNKDFQLC